MTRAARVYRVFDDLGRLLYVGSTTDLPRRFRQHERTDSPWVPYAAYVSWDAPAADARAVEALAILNERPRFNKRGNWPFGNEDRLPYADAVPMESLLPKAGSAA